MNNKTLYGLIGLIVGILATWLFFSSTSKTQITKSTNQTPNQIDAHFIEQMIPHHEDAIMMAKLAEQKAKRSEIKKLAKDIITAQQKEIDEMKEWYKDWYGRDLPTGDEVMSQHGMMGNKGMHMGMMGDETDMKRLENASDFDKAFIEEMIPHHQMAVMMATMLKAGTTRTEMSKLAEDIIEAQTKEIEQMRVWYTKW